MSIRYPDDVMLPPTGVADARPARLRPTVFVPIAIAVAGVVAILFGGQPAAPDPGAAIGATEQIDPVVTGAIRPASFDQMSSAEQRHALEMLDR